MSDMMIPHSSNARRALGSLKRLGAELAIDDSDDCVVVHFDYGIKDSAQLHFGLLIIDDNTDVILDVSRMHFLEELGQGSLFVFNKFNAIDPFDFVNTGILFFECEVPKLRFLISSKDHALLDNMDACVTRVAHHVEDLANLLASLDLNNMDLNNLDDLNLIGLEHEEEEVFVGRHGEAADNLDGSFATNQTSSHKAGKRSFFGRLFS